MDKLAMIFPGQGAQYVGMGENFYKNYPICKQTYEQASDCAGIDIAELCFRGSVTKLNNIGNMQLAVVTTNLAIARAFLADYGLPPQFCFGHSVGEYSALVFAGAVDFGDAIKMLQKRTELLGRVSDAHMMIVENIPTQKLSDTIKENNICQDVFISGYNSAQQNLVSGRDDAMDILGQALLEDNAALTPLLESPPFHCPLLADVAVQYYEFLQSFRYYPMRFPIISNVTGRPFSDCSMLPQMLSSHLVRPVLWQQSVKCCENYGVNMFIEMGPKNLTLGLVRQVLPDVPSYCFGQKKDREAIAQYLQEHPAHKLDVPDFVGRCLGIAASTKNSGQSGEEFEKHVVEPYRAIKDIQNTLRESGQKPTLQDMSKAKQLLLEILNAKKVPVVECENWLKQLQDETSTCYLDI